MNSVSRRSFLKSASVAALAAGARSGMASSPAHRSTTSGPGASDATTVITPALSRFQYSQVQLLDGPLRQQFDRNHAFYLALDDDRLLKPLRQRAGQPAPGDYMGGWYDSYDDEANYITRGFAPAHSFGQYVSALARAYAITGDRATQQKVDRLVAGYTATISPGLYKNLRYPAYTYDKLVCALLDADALTGSSIALQSLVTTTDTALPFLPEKALSQDEQMGRPHKNESFTWDESYTISENLFLAYQRTADPRYRALAVRFLEDDTWFNPLSEGNNVLPGQHAYSHMNSLCSAMQAYITTGSQKHFRAARNAFAMMQSSNSFATGGWGPTEHFIVPGSGGLGESLISSHASFETPCGAYAHFKLTRYLLGVTRDARYGDSMERVLYNTILGAKPMLEDGSTFYYSDYSHDAHKAYHVDKWPCCSGSFPQLTADYGISSYFRSPDGVLVNLYVPSKLSWQEQGAQCTLTQRTSYPATAQTEFNFTTTKPVEFTLSLRIPEWAGAATSVAINGKRITTPLGPGSFATLRRAWRSGDHVELELDRTMRLEAVDSQHADMVALVRGPVTLFAVNTTEARSQAVPAKDAPPAAKGTEPPAEKATAEFRPAPLERLTLLTAKPLSQTSAELRAETESGTLSLKPFSEIGDEHYRLYQQVTG